MVATASVVTAKGEWRVNDKYGGAYTYASGLARAERAGLMAKRKGRSRTRNASCRPPVSRAPDRLRARRAGGRGANAAHRN